CDARRDENYVKSGSLDANDVINITRRDFLATAASGLGGAAFASLLHAEGLLATEAMNPLAPRLPHYAPKAKQCIFLFMEGGTSQIDLFDPKPMLNKLNGQKLPDSVTKNVHFAFLHKES